MFVKCKVTVYTSHYQNEVPWELPEGWVWSTIDEISYSILYGVSESAKTTGTYKLLRITDIQNGKVDWPSVPFTDFEDEKAAQYILMDNDILFARTGATVGKSYLSQCTPNNAIYASYLIRIRFSKELCPQYVKYYFESGYYWEQISINSVGVGQPNVNGTILSGLNIPIPPIDEQEKIITVASKLLREIDDLNDAQKAVFDTSEKLKESILGLAIHGRLAPQDTSDEPAIELLKRINPDFKPSDNLHYEGILPNGWCLTHLNDVALYGDTSSIDVSSIDPDSWILELEDIEKDTGRIIDMKSKADREVSGVRHSFKKGQLLYSKLRTYLNKVLIAPNDGFCTTEIVPITAGKAILPDYLLMVMRSPYFLEYTASCSYGVKMPRLGTIDAQKAIIPLPPLAEQSRIVEKISELMIVLSTL